MPTWLFMIRNLPCFSSLAITLPPKRSIRMARAALALIPPMGLPSARLLRASEVSVSDWLSVCFSASCTSSKRSCLANNSSSCGKRSLSLSPSSSIVASARLISFALKLMASLVTAPVTFLASSRMALKKSEAWKSAPFLNLASPTSNWPSGVLAVMNTSPSTISANVSKPYTCITGPLEIPFAHDGALSPLAFRKGSMLKYCVPSISKFVLRAGNALTT